MSMDDQALELEGHAGFQLGDEWTALRAIPEQWGMPAPELLSKLPKGGKKDAQNESCRVCGGWHKPGAVHLDYMGHADITLALIAIDPGWDWAPAGVEEDGSPVIRKNNGMLVMWGTLTVLGVTRRCVGTCETSKPEAEKELVGDLLRNGAMRFGIATKLWSKTEREEQKLPAERPAQQEPTRRERTNPARPNQASGASNTRATNDDAPPPREAADDAPAVPPELAEERRRMRALIKNLGDNVKRETMLEIAGNSAGRAIGSSNELTVAELRVFNTELEGVGKGTHELGQCDDSDQLIIRQVSRG